MLERRKRDGGKSMPITKDRAVGQKARTGGRPRNEAARRLILSTTLQLLRKETLRSLTIEAIAKAAGVSKATIYRWWNSKAQIVVEAFMEHHIVRTPMRRDLSPGAAIADHLRNLTEQYAGWPGRIVAQILAEAQSDPEIGREFRERFHYGRRAVVRETVEQWRRTGEIPESLEMEALMDLIYAPVYLRLMVGHAPLDQKFVNEHVTLIYGLLGAPVPPIAA